MLSYSNFKSLKKFFIFIINFYSKHIYLSLNLKPAKKTLSLFPFYDIYNYKHKI